MSEWWYCSKMDGRGIRSQGKIPLLPIFIVKTRLLSKHRKLRDKQEFNLAPAFLFELQLLMKRIEWVTALNNFQAFGHPQPTHRKWDFGHFFNWICAYNERVFPCHHSDPMHLSIVRFFYLEGWWSLNLSTLWKATLTCDKIRSRSHIKACMIKQLKNLPCSSTFFLDAEKYLLIDFDRWDAAGLHWQHLARLEKMFN